MPLVRIDMLRGTSAEYRRQVGDAVHAALIDFGAPPEDKFQVITEHDPDNFRFSSNYLGINRSDALIIVQITAVAGRTTAGKRALYVAVADGLVAAVKLRREDVFVSLVEVAKDNWSFGLGLAQYAD